MWTMRTILLIAATALALTAADAPKSVRLYVLDCGRLAIEDPARLGFKKEQLKTVDISMGCYLIAHPKGTLFWDTGAVPDSYLKPGMAKASLTYGTITKSIASQLAAVGYAPKDINFLAISHYHWDHIGNANLFASAMWLTPKVERDMMLSGKSDSRYPENYAALKNSKFTVTDNKAGEYDVFGDGTVILKATPGHTEGHTSLFVKLKNSQPVVLSGDLYHYPEEVTTGIVPPIDVNKDQTTKSRKDLDAYVKKQKAVLWIQHDLLQFEKLKKAPLFYE
jgi:glyoxylase-like metal-dependent hydrolase (beta-lactamase superfamily II)